MRWKKVVTDYFSFSRRDRIGILTLVALIVIVYLLPKAFSAFSGPPISPVDSSFVSKINKPETAPGLSNQPINSTDYQPDRYPSSYHLFYFDPNTLAPEKWRELGLRDKTIQTIQHYINKGGQFRKPEDLQRIYGLHLDEYQRLLPFVKIATPSAPAPPNNKYINNREERKVFRYDAVDINTADTTAFIALPGIASKLANRIVNFREKLGGFYAIEQVGEVYGLQDSVFQQLKQYLQLNDATVKKININTATVDELKAHPYIRYNIANAIVAYRNQHGAFQSLEDLKKIMLITDEVYTKMIPYSSF